MPNIRALQIFICLLFLCLTTCSSESQESSLLEKKLRERVEAVNRFFKGNKDKLNNESATLTITSPIKVSLNLKEKFAITDTEMKIEIHSPNKQPVTVPIRITWLRYEDGDWQIEYVIPQEISMWLLFDKIIENKDEVKGLLNQ